MYNKAIFVTQSISRHLASFSQESESGNVILPSAKETDFYLSLSTLLDVAILFQSVLMIPASGWIRKT